jgi:hypothetical protein
MQPAPLRLLQRNPSHARGGVLSLFCFGVRCYVCEARATDTDAELRNLTRHGVRDGARRGVLEFLAGRHNARWRPEAPAGVVMDANARSCRCPVRSLLGQQLVGLTKNSVVTSPLALIVK